MKRMVIEERYQVDLFGRHRWTGRLDRDGYGRAGSDMAHRRAWEEAVGPIPDGMQIDHLCRTRDCINVDHLEVVTPWENVHRSPDTIPSI